MTEGHKVGTVVLKLEHTPENRDSNSVGTGWGLRICTSNKSQVLLAQGPQF